MSLSPIGGLKEPAIWVGVLALLPLALLLLTGLSLFVLPYAAKWRSARGAGGLGANAMAGKTSKKSAKVAKC